LSDAFEVHPKDIYATPAASAEPLTLRIDGDKAADKSAAGALGPGLLALTSRVAGDSFCMMHQ
jgi:hypothetical protein